MATHTESRIFDRTLLLGTLERECLGPTGGSAAIVGPHKVGKTRLLEHIAFRATSQETIFCRVDVFSLRGFLAKGEKLSDHIFLRFLIVQILVQIDEWIDELSLQEETYQAEISKAQQRLLVGGLGPLERETLQITRTALQHKLRDLQTLRELKGRAEAHVGEAQLESSNLWSLFNTLKKLHKRVVLLIDNFDQIVEESGFSDNLFNFLRGAHSDKKIFTIACSPVRLMERLMETKTRPADLFNHIKSQLLEPFNRDEALAFLEWDGFAPSDPPLTPEEKDYLYSLGGGSPFFLECARSCFLEKGRPVPKTRREFERRYLAADFTANGFRQIWDRCTDDERRVLRDVVRGLKQEDGVVDELEWKGYLVRENGVVRPFSTLFTDFIGAQSKPLASVIGEMSRELATNSRSPSSNISVDSVTLPYRVMPTALYAAAPDAAEQVIFRITNSSDEPVSVQLECSIPSYFQETRKTVIVTKATHDIPLRLVFDQNKQFSEPLATQVAYKVSVITGNSTPAIKADTTDIVRLLPLNHFLLARTEGTTKKLLDFSWLIAAWVTRKGEGLVEIRRRALQLEPLVGERVPPGPNTPTDVRIRVAAIYKAIQEQGIVYNDDSLVFHAEDQDYMQRVQFVAETLRLKTANCLDGSVLFASVLSMCGLDPLILLVPGHAIVGWKIPGGAEKTEFLETTVLSKVGFDVAWDVGTKLFDQWRHRVKYSDGELMLIDDARDFALLIDVHEIWRRKKLVSNG